MLRFKEWSRSRTLLWARGCWQRFGRVWSYFFQNFVNIIICCALEIIAHSKYSIFNFNRITDLWRSVIDIHNARFILSIMLRMRNFHLILSVNTGTCPSDKKCICIFPKRAPAFLIARYLQEWTFLWWRGISSCGNWLWNKSWVWWVPKVHVILDFWRVLILIIVR